MLHTQFSIVLSLDWMRGNRRSHNLYMEWTLLPQPDITCGLKFGNSLDMSD